MTMKTHITRWLGAAMAVLALGACDDTLGPEALDQALLMDAAVVAADATLEDLGLMGRAFGFPSPSGLGLVEANGPGGGGPGRPGGHHGIGGSLSGTRDVVFYDVDGEVQEAYDALTTVRITATVDVEGEISRSNWSASIARSRTMEITGLAGENTTRIFNGSGSEDVSRSRVLDNGETRSRDMTGSFTYTDLEVPTPDQEVRYPLSGTITRQMTLTVLNGSDGERTRTVDVTITFDGTATAVGTINGESFEIDLTAREGHFPLRRGFGRSFGG
jgi:hypothetical protein